MISKNMNYKKRKAKRGGGKEVSSCGGGDSNLFYS